ncbi:MAG: MFS transporter, partial [Gammaproteobacteria bacterium]
MPPQTVRFSAFLFAYYAHAGTFATYASLFYAARGMSAPQIGVLVSLNQIMRLFGPNLWGWVADRSERRVAVLRTVCAGAVLATCGLFFAASFWEFFAVLALLNLCTSAQAPLAEALMIAEMRGDMSNYGRMRMWGSVGFIAAVLASG